MNWGRKLALGVAGALMTVAIAPHAMAQAASTAESREAAIGQIIDHLRNKRIDEAQRLIDPLLADYEKLYAGEKRAIFCADSQAEAILYMGMAGANGGPREAIAIDRGWCLALWAKGYVLVDQGNFVDGAKFLERATSMAPLKSQYLSELGYAYQAQRLWPKSLDTYSRAAEAAEMSDLPDATRNFELGRAWRGMGFALIELGRLDEAEAMFRKCLELDPNDAKAQGELNYIARQRASAPKS